MKKYKKLIRKYRKQILTCCILLLLLVIFGLTAVNVLTGSPVSGSVFFVVALLMVALAVNYSMQKKTSKGVYIFYALSAVACIAIGIILRYIPAV